MFWMCMRLTFIYRFEQIIIITNSISFREGSNLTPAHHYSDFRFKTYAPIAFRYFRELFGIQPDDFLVCLTLNCCFYSFSSFSEKNFVTLTCFTFFVHFSYRSAMNLFKNFQILVRVVVYSTLRMTTSLL